MPLNLKPNGNDSSLPFDGCGEDDGLIPDYERPRVDTGQALLWRNLKPGTRVEAAWEGGPRLEGIIDVLMIDGSTVWVILDDGRGRISISEGDGIDLQPIG